MPIFFLGQAEDSADMIRLRSFFGIESVDLIIASDVVACPYENAYNDLLSTFQLLTSSEKVLYKYTAFNFLSLFPILHLLLSLWLFLIGSLSSSSFHIILMSMYIYISASAHLHLYSNLVANHLSVPKTAFNRGEVLQEIWEAISCGGIVNRGMCA